MQLEILVLSKTGGRPTNEDACGFWPSPEACFCVLSDGLGGHYGGDVASKLVVQRALDWFRETPECSARAIEASLRSANLAIMRKQRQDPRRANMRATAVVLAIDTLHGSAIWGHIGDSRLYCFRQGRIIAQTRDHSILQSMVDSGHMLPKEVRASSLRNTLLAALGDEHFEPRIEPVNVQLQDRDVFLLCSDGLWEYVEGEEMERTLNASVAAADWLAVLERQVLARGHKGQDNYSAMAVWCTEPSG